jgi:hypothetical protein
MLMFYIRQTSGLVVHLIEITNSSERPLDISLAFQTIGLRAVKNVATFEFSLYKQHITRRENME